MRVCNMYTNEGFACKTHYINLVHSEKFHVLRMADNAFCAKTLSVELSTTLQHNTARISIFAFWRITRFAGRPFRYCR